jgi:hypothetical protein
MIRKLIRCTTCNQVIPNYEGYELTRVKSLPGVEWSEADLASAREFLRTHCGHTLEELLVDEDSWISEKFSYEPLGVGYVLAGNAGQTFLIRRTKSALNQPASYGIVAGRLKIFNASLKIQENDLRKQIAAEKGFSPLLKERMEKFVQVFRDEIARISPEKVEEETEEIYDGEGFTLAYAGLNNSRWERILNRCRLYFVESELKALRRFIDENRNPPDVLSIQVERRISILPLAVEGSIVGLQDRKETEEEMETPSIALSPKGFRRDP